MFPSVSHQPPQFRVSSGVRFMQAFFWLRFIGSRKITNFQRVKVTAKNEDDARGLRGDSNECYLFG